LKKYPIIFVVIFLLTTYSSTAISNDISESDLVYDSMIGLEYKRDGIVYNVHLAEIGQWKKAKDHDFRPTLIAVHFYVRNSDETRKVDLSNGFQYKLFDEFNNFYIQQAKPEGYGTITEFLPQQYPSLYPEETYGKIVFFEAPIKSTRYLVLSVDASGVGYSESMNIKIPMNQIELASKKLARAYNLTFKRKQADGSEPQSPIDKNSIKIISPPDRSPVAPGDIVNIKVRLAKGTIPPVQIYVVSPIYTLEDRSVSNEYNLRIPGDYPKGELTVVVIGRWIVNGNEILLSDSVTLNVIDKKERCLHGCVSQDNV